MKHTKSEYDKYSTLQEPITFEELLTVISISVDTPQGLLLEWMKRYPNIKATVHCRKNK